MSSPISNLPKIIQQDFTEITTPIPSGYGASREHINDRQQLVALAVARVFILLFSLVLVCSLVKKISSPIHVVTNLIGLVVGHELFTLAYNKSKILRAKDSVMNLMGVVGSALMTNMSSIVQGNDLVHPLAEGTLFPVFWTRNLFDKVEREINRAISGRR